MFKVLKYAGLLLILAVPAVFLFGCTQVSGEEPIYIYGIGLDANQEQMCLYVLTAEDGGTNGNSGNGENSGKGTGQGGSKQKESGEDKKQSFQIMTYEGENVEEVFGAFFKQFKDAYTGTNKLYAVGENMSEEQIWDFKIYLTNSNKLPVKRDTVTNEDPYGFLEENAEKLMKKQ